MATGDRVLLTVLLHHDQSKPLDEIMAHLKKTGFYRDFPPEGSELVSWVVAIRGDAAAVDGSDAADQPSPPTRAVSVATDIHPVVDGRRNCRRLFPRKVPRLVMLFWFPFGSGAHGTRSRSPGAYSPVCCPSHWS